MKRKFLIVTIVLLLLVSAGIVSAQSARVIGLSLPSTEGIFYVALVESAQETADSLGATLIVTDAKADVATELANVQSLVDQGVKALLFTPVDPIQSAAAVTLANSANVPVFLFGSMVQGAPMIDLGADSTGEDTTASPDDAALTQVQIADLIDSSAIAEGELAAKTLCDRLSGAGNIIELVNFPTLTDGVVPGESVSFTVARQRSASFNSALTDSCPGVTVQHLDVTNLDKKGVQGLYLSALKAGDVNGVVGYDTLSVMGAVETTVIARKPHIILLGFDVSDSLLSAITAGRLAGAIAPDPMLLGETGVKTVVDFLAGQDASADASIDVTPTLLDAATLENFRGSRKFS